MNILLPIDGSQQSIDAFKKGINYAEKLKAHVYVVLVFRQERDDLPVAERTSLLNRLEEFARNNGVAVQKEIVYGDPRTQISSELVSQWGINLIIMSATGKGRVAKMIIGSTTEYVVRNAQCDVMVVH